jgi:hypothetical protein
MAVQFVTPSNEFQPDGAQRDTQPLEGPHVYLVCCVELEHRIESCPQIFRTYDTYDYQGAQGGTLQEFRKLDGHDRPLGPQAGQGTLDDRRVFADWRTIR